MTLLWLQPLNTSVNIAFGYNATIFCADQASNEVTFAILPVEAIVSYNNDANYLVEVRHHVAATCSAASLVCCCQSALNSRPTLSHS